MTTVLVSFIGTGNLENLEYEETDYYFQDETIPRKTAIFGSALLAHLKANGEQVERWLIMGTKESIWAELIKMSANPGLFRENSTRKFLDDESFQYAADNDYVSEVSQELFQAELDEWQQILTKNLAATEVVCRLVGDATEPVSQYLIFQSLRDAIEYGNKVVFDITHGLRSQPVITSFVLMYLQYLRKIRIEDITFYYGAFDSRNKSGKVHTLNFCNELLKATEAVAIFEQTGNYEQIGKNLKLSDSFNHNLEKLAFLDEVNKTNPEIPNQLNKEISNAKFLPLQQSLSDIFKKPLYWASKKTLSSQLREKSLVAFNRKQYFKAILILTEAIVVAYGECCGDAEISNNLDLHFYRNMAENELIQVLNRTENQILKNLKKLRNAVAHGTDANGIEIEAINAREAVENESKLRKIFNEGNDLFTKIIKSEIGR